MPLEQAPPTEPPLFDPDALFRPPPVNQAYVPDPKHDKVSFTPGVIVGIFLAMVLLGGAVFWAMGQQDSTPTALQPLQGTLPTIPADLPVTTLPPQLGGPQVGPQAPPVPVTAVPGWANRTVAGVSVEVPVDCAAMQTPQLRTSLGTIAAVLWACVTNNPRRIVMVATLNVPDDGLDGTLEQRLDLGRKIADELAGRGANAEVVDHPLAGRPGVLLNVSLNQNGVDVFETVQLGYTSRGFTMVIVGQANSPWTEGMRVIDSAH